jgi:nitrogen fixation NifU-like protein
VDLYADNILDHYRHPRHKAVIDDATVTHEEANHACGDVASVQLKLDGGRITGIGWSGDGCAISQAGMSLLSEELTGMAADDVLRMKKQDMYDLLGVPVGPRRFKCALLCLHTVKNALRKVKGEAPQSWLDTVEIEDE